VGVTTEGGQYRGKERQTEGIDDAFLLIGNALQATDPLAAIADYADSLEAMGASESWDEKVP
jgi:hypothetical protein